MWLSILTYILFLGVIIFITKNIDKHYDENEIDNADCNFSDYEYFNRK